MLQKYVVLSNFLFRLTCDDNCLRIHIADYGKDCVNNVQGEPNKISNDIHHRTSACYIQANGLVGWITKLCIRPFLNILMT